MKLRWSRREKRSSEPAMSLGSDSSMSQEGEDDIMNGSSNVNTQEFYGTYHGHPVKDLEKIYRSLQSGGEKRKSVIWLAGDSTLDNKFWIPSVAAATNGYQKVLSPPESHKDICYFVNRSIAEKRLSKELFCMNCAVEGSTLRERSSGLFPQEEFLRNHIQEDDTLVVSIGGNDVCLNPTLSTIWQLLCLIHFSRKKSVEKGSGLGQQYFLRMFKDELESYITKLVGVRKPKKILVCMIYFPDENTRAPSWASLSLSMLRYNTRPEKVHHTIKFVFKHATSKVAIPGSDVTALPLYDILDSHDTKDYVDRIEPSEQGGAKMAAAFVRHHLGEATKEAV